MSPHRRQILFLVAALLLAVWLFPLLQPWFSGSRFMGQPAPEFTLRVASGPGAETHDRVRLSDLRGQVVVLDFWASWCGPCRESTPILSAVAKQYENRQVQIFGINSESIGPGLLAFVQQSWGFAYPNLLDTALEARLAYDVNAFPTLFVIDAEGIVRFVHHGAASERRLRSEIDSLLK